MAQIDRRDKSKIYKDGSSLLAVGLTTAQAVAALGVGTVGGWHVVGYLGGGSVGREASVTKDYDEAGDFLGSITESDEWVIKNTLKQTDDATLRLVEYWQEHDLPVRYPLPAGVDDQGKPLHQLYYHPSMRAEIGNDEIATTRGQRNMGVTARGSRKLLVRETVSLETAAQATWPADLAGAKDTAFPGA